MPARSRRHFVHAVMRVSAAVAALPLVARCGLRSSTATDARAGKRLGMLFSYPTEPVRRAVMQYLREHGYVMGRTLAVTYRESPDEVLGDPIYATELVRLGCDVILASGGAARVAQHVTTTVPIVFIFDGDPVAAGLVPNLQRPGGNLTGVGGYGPEFAGKLLEYLKAAIPTLVRVGYLWESLGPLAAMELQAAQTAGQTLGVAVLSLPTHSPDDLAGAFALALAHRIDGLLVKGSPLTASNADRIIAFATEYQLPTVSDGANFAWRGGLLEYTANETDVGQHAGRLVYAIFQGATPGDLPVVRFSKFDLTINLRTAQAIGRMLPPSVLTQATTVIP